MLVLHTPRSACWPAKHSRTFLLDYMKHLGSVLLTDVVYNTGNPICSYEAD